jgi:hypothetical protein
MGLFRGPGNRRYPLFPGKGLCLDNPAQFVRACLAGIAPGKARHICRNPLQLTGVATASFATSLNSRAKEKAVTAASVGT